MTHRSQNGASVERQETFEALLGSSSLGPRRGLHRIWPTGVCTCPSTLLSPQVLALIVFSCIFGEGYSNTHESKQLQCVFNQNEDACRYGSAIGVLAFLASAFFLVVDAFFSQISNATDRKYLVIGDLLFSGMPAALAHQGFTTEGPWCCWEGLPIATQDHEPHLRFLLGPPVPWDGTQGILTSETPGCWGTRVRHGIRFLDSAIPPSSGPLSPHCPLLLSVTQHKALSPSWAPGNPVCPWGQLFPPCLPSSLDFPVVRWFLLPDQPVGSHQI